MPTLGILGGGQLARMTAYAAFRLGLRVHILERTAGSPAGQIAHKDVVGTPADHDILIEFARECDVITLESEFVNEEHLAVAEHAGHVILPRPQSVGLIQDKLTQKETVRRVGVATAAFSGVESPADARDFGHQHGYPFVLKTRRNGYDGYGNATIGAEDVIELEWERITGGNRERTLYAESFVPFDKELAVMVARGRSGEMATYPVAQTIQQNHICHYVLAPAGVDESVAARARAIAQRAVESIDGIGVFGVELFLCPDNSVLFNEVAPRPHNSGHYTIEGCVTSQFENHIRAILGWPLGSTELRAPSVVMANILGRGDASGTVANYPEVLASPTAHIHIYGKAHERKGRKMGHVTVLASSLDEAFRIAQETEGHVMFR